MKVLIGTFKQEMAFPVIMISDGPFAALISTHTSDPWHRDGRPEQAGGPGEPGPGHGAAGDGQGHRGHRVRGNTDCHHMLSIHQRFFLVRNVNWRISATVPSGFKCLTLDCTAGHKGVIGDLSSESISAHFQGLPNRVQLAATIWSGKIWISGWILPHFDVRTISVAWKLKELSNIFWQKIFFLLHPLSKGVAPLCTAIHYHFMFEVIIHG